MEEYPKRKFKRFKKINGEFIYQDVIESIDTPINTKEERYIDINDGEKPNGIVNIVGVNNGILNQSHSLEQDFTKPIIQTTVNNTDKIPKKKSVLEITAWIVGIIAGLISLYEFVLKKL